MRFRTLLVWVIVIGSLAWAGSTIVIAGSSYLAASGVIDQAVADAIGRRKAQTGTGMPQEGHRDFIDNVRSNVMARARTQGIELPPAGLQVKEAPEGVRVSAKWSIPVLLYDEVVLFHVPLSATRFYAVP